MDTSEMRELLHGYLGELNWASGITKDDILEHLAGRDDALRTAVNQYVTEGTYADADAVMTVIPVQAWQDTQGDAWRGAENQPGEDTPKTFQSTPVGQNTDNVYHQGGPAPQTPGFGHTTADGDAGQTDMSAGGRGTGGAAFGDEGSNAGEVDLGITNDISGIAVE